MTSLQAGRLTSWQAQLNDPVCKTCLRQAGLNKKKCEDMDGSIILCSEKRVNNGKNKKV